MIQWPFLGGHNCRDAGEGTEKAAKKKTLLLKDIHS
jgi:hypothetical protein